MLVGCPEYRSDADRQNLKPENRTVASEAVLTLTDDSFQTDVLNSNEPVLVDFWAEWCQPCKMLAPTMDEIATESVSYTHLTLPTICSV